jgi:putative ABC transport system permease protein
MRTAVRELARRPGRFVPVGGALVLLVMLLMVLGGFLDGLTLVQTGAYRAHDGETLVFAADTELQLARSRIDAGLQDRIAAVDGVAAIGGLASVPATALVDGADEPLDVVVFGYDLRTDVLPPPPGDGEAVVDAALADQAGVAVGDALRIGAGDVEVTVAALVDDVSQGAPTIWVSMSAWRGIVTEVAPAQALPDGVVPAVVARPAAGIDPAVLAARIDRVDGADGATVPTTIDALPVVAQQAATFQGIIGVTFVVTLLVVALFFALLTLERSRLYAVLKAVGARTRDLVIGVSVQAVVVAGGAVLIGGALALAFAAVLPPDLPVRLVPDRLGQVAVGTLVTALVGSLVTIRRIAAIDPATAIG